ncbi:MAG: DUF2277 domain-containing protein [Candidatus Eremiobacteraeota bacterium]|nr:DUF2277 domain-containing protein [Candidatus Eremiobacteraeota bacterium]
MCRSIHRLVAGKSLGSPDEIRASSLQYVRKISGINKPSRKNADAFDRAVNEVTVASARLLGMLTKAPEETAKA